MIKKREYHIKISTMITDEFYLEVFIRQVSTFYWIRQARKEVIPITTFSESTHIKRYISKQTAPQNTKSILPARLPRLQHKQSTISQKPINYIMSQNDCSANIKSTLCRDLHLHLYIHKKKLITTPNQTSSRTNKTLQKTTIIP